MDQLGNSLRNAIHR